MSKAILNSAKAYYRSDPGFLSWKELGIRLLALSLSSSYMTVTGHFPSLDLHLLLFKAMELEEMASKFAPSNVISGYPGICSSGDIGVTVMPERARIASLVHLFSSTCSSLSVIGRLMSP